MIREDYGGLGIQEYIFRQFRQLDSRKTAVTVRYEATHMRIKEMKAYLLKESLDRLWSYTYEGAILRYLKSWIDRLRGSGFNR